MPIPSRVAKTCPKANSPKSGAISPMLKMMSATMYHFRHRLLTSSRYAPNDPAITYDTPTSLVVKILVDSHDIFKANVSKPIMMSEPPKCATIQMRMVRDVP